jgi:hypothetical protein
MPVGQQQGGIHSWQQLQALQQQRFLQLQVDPLAWWQQQMWATGAGLAAQNEWVDVDRE